MYRAHKGKTPADEFLAHKAALVRSFVAHSARGLKQRKVAAIKASKKVSKPKRTVYTPPSANTRRRSKGANI